MEDKIIALETIIDMVIDKCKDYDLEDLLRMLETKIDIVEDKITELEEEEE